jgi:hypothetical protein
MAHSALTAGVAAAFALTAGACDRLPDRAATRSVTVRLPPPRPEAPAPGFKPIAADRDRL